MGGKSSKDQPLPGSAEPETWPHGLRVLRDVAEVCAAVTSVAEHHKLKHSQELLQHANTIKGLLHDWDGRGLDRLRGVQVTRIASALEIFEKELQRTYTKVLKYKEKRFIISKRRLSTSLEKALGKVNTDYHVFRKALDAILQESPSAEPEDPQQEADRASAQHSQDGGIESDGQPWQEDGFGYDSDDSDDSNDFDDNAHQRGPQIDSASTSPRGESSAAESEESKERKGSGAGSGRGCARGRGSAGPQKEGSVGPQKDGSATPSAANSESFVGDSDTGNDEPSVDFTRFGSIWHQADPSTGPPVSSSKSEPPEASDSLEGPPAQEPRPYADGDGFEFSPAKPPSYSSQPAAHGTEPRSAEHPPSRVPRQSAQGTASVHAGRVEADPQELLRDLILRADNGDPGSALEAACLCREGQLIEYDPVAALGYMRIAAEDGHPDACYQMGCMAEEGEGLAVPDLQEAAAWYRKAAFLGHVMASAAFGRALELGAGVDQHLEAAAAWYKRAATAGSGRAANNLGKMYFDGRGVREDRTVASAWFAYAVQCKLDGSTAAFNNLGICYEDGIGLESDLGAAAECYQQAADRGHVGALVNLAYLQFSRGDFPSARMSFELAASQGNADALYNLACLLERQAVISEDARQSQADRSPGEYASGRNREEATASATVLYEKAAYAGDPRAQHRLAIWYWDEGMVDEALALFHLAASQHHAPSLNSLGIIAEEGQGGCDKDLEAAWECYRLATLHGSAEAKANLKALEEVLEVSESRRVLKREGFKLRLIDSGRHPTSRR